MILVVGATGTLGSMITRQLLAKGEALRILVRPRSNYHPLIDLGAEPVTGDLKDRESLDKACEGIDTIITTANSAQRGGADNVENVDLNGNRSLIDAAKAAGVKHFIFISGLGSDVNSPVPFVQAKAKTEHYLRESGMNYTILASNIFMGMWLGIVVGLAVKNDQPAALVGSGNKKHTFVAENDVAAFAVASVHNPAAVNQYIAVAGPQAVSWMDIFDTAGRVLGQKIVIRNIPPTEPLPFVPPYVGMTMSGLMAFLDTYETPLDMVETANLYNVRLTSVEELLRGMFSS